MSRRTLGTLSLAALLLALPFTPGATAPAATRTVVLQITGMH